MQKDCVVFSIQVNTQQSGMNDKTVLVNHRIISTSTNRIKTTVSRKVHCQSQRGSELNILRSRYDKSDIKADGILYTEPRPDAYHGRKSCMVYFLTLLWHYKLNP